ncbi:MAG: SDR family NAD(P)-dependent oxidoreductase [Thermoleophilia bacterium]|nr:SDR family NAD(P)-dependent oxidoreductase [Thermoleophilia bacterium]GIK76964.1 MAG: short chain dehydrogenase [Actinomycetes bacterium]
MGDGCRWPTAVISGGGSGIGLGLARKLSRRGTAVAVLDRSISDELKGWLDAGGDAPAAVREVDVADGDALADAVADAADAIGPPALAINSAGVQASAAFGTLSEERFRSVVEVNLVGSRNFSAAVLPLMGPGAQLALVASLAGLVPNYGYAAYSASKFGVVGLAGCLRLECKPRGVDVSVICPPEVETPMVTEERRTGDPVGLELKKFSGTLTLEDACEEILAGLAGRRWMVVPGRRARLTGRLVQLAPALMRRTSDRMVRRALAASGRR